MRKINSILCKLISFAFLVLIAVTSVSIESYADNGYASYVNSSTGYSAVIYDTADYLTDGEETALIEEMKPITEYTNVFFLTDENNRYYTESYSKNLCISTLENSFGYYSDAVIYLIDNEYDYIYAQGTTYDVITTQKAYSITDNVYNYSADGLYYKAASRAFSDIYALLDGRKIAEPMKYICNVFIALLAAFLINYCIVSRMSKLKKATSQDLVMGSLRSVEVRNINPILVNTTRVYSPQSSGGGGGGSHGGGGHGGGGGHHGGGGGHSH